MKRRRNGFLSMGTVLFIGLAVGFIAGLIVLFLFPMSTTLVSAEVKWSELRPMGDSNVTWHSLAQNSTGQYLLVGDGADEGGRIYLSKDYGNTVAEIRPAGNTVQKWVWSNMSSDGSHMVALVEHGKIYTSADFGKSWSETSPAGASNQQWHASCMSADGLSMIVASGGDNAGRLFKSINGGKAWIELHPTSSGQDWDYLDCNDNASVIIADVYHGRVYRSTDGGSTWQETRPAGDASSSWWYVSVDGKGDTALIGNDSGSIYQSQDFGVTWTPISINSSGNWSVVAVSDDGKTMAVAQKKGLGRGRLFTSFDSGATWSETRPAGDMDEYWHNVVISPDGRHFAAAVYGGRVYLGSR